MLYFIEIMCLYSDIKTLILSKYKKKSFIYEHVDTDIFNHNIGLLISDKFICRKYSSLSNDSCVITYEGTEINISWTYANVQDCDAIIFNVIIN
jgi:hypothetical protein